MRTDTIPGYFLEEAHAFRRDQPEDDSPDDDDDAEWNTLNNVRQLRRGDVITTAPDRAFTILLVGETGTGKTTFISFLTNVLAGIPVKSCVDRRDPTNEAGGGQKQSQTQHPLLYELVSRNDVIFRIVDTPGLSDTRGIGQDAVHKQEIAKMMRDHVTEVDAVLLFTNGTVPRLGPATEYVFNVLTAMFPRSIADNIGIVFTNVASEMKVNFDFNSLPEQIPRDHVFYVDNPLALQQRFRDMEVNGHNRKALKLLRQEIVSSETAALNTLVEILEWLINAKPQPTKAIVELYEQTQAIEAQISRIHASMLASARMQEELTRIQVDIDRNLQTADLYKDYQTIVTKARMNLTPTEMKYTICMEHGCQNNCWHAPGRFPFQLIMPPGNTSYEKVVNGLKGRFVGCGACRHPYGDHQTGDQRWQEVCGTETRTDVETKRKFDNASTNAERKGLMRETIERRLAGVQEDIAAATDGVSALVERYASLSLSGSFTSHIYTAIKLLNVNLESLRHDSAPRATIEQMEQTIAALEEKLAVLEEVRAKARGVRRGSAPTGGPRGGDAFSMSMTMVKDKVTEGSEVINKWLSSVI